MTIPKRPTIRVAVLAPMLPELRAVVRAGRLTRTRGGTVFSHSGRAGNWDVVASRIGIGPARARRATERLLAAGDVAHVMVVGVAGGLDPALPIGAVIVPSRVCLHPDGPLFHAHPLSSRTPEGGLITTDGLLSDEEVWRPLLESGFGAVDMEAAAVAEVCENAGVDWSVYRGISDRPAERLVDQAVLALSKPDGSADIVAVLKYLARDPRRATLLARLSRCMNEAAEAAASAAFHDLAHS